MPLFKDANRSYWAATPSNSEKQDLEDLGNKAVEPVKQ